METRSNLQHDSQKCCPVCAESRANFRSVDEGDGDHFGGGGVDFVGDIEPLSAAALLLA